MRANAAYWIAAQAGVTPVAMGDPGTGKTEVFYAFCRATGRKPYVLIPSSRDTTDYYGCPFPGEIEIGNGNGKKRKVAVMNIASPHWAARCWDGHKWAIFLDELTTAVPVIQAAHLRIIAKKYVGEIPLPKDTWILAAANPPENAPNGIEFCAPMANRMYHHQWEVDTDVVLAGYANGCRFSAPEFDVLPKDWETNLIGRGRSGGCLPQALAGPAEQDARGRCQPGWSLAIPAELGVCHPLHGHGPSSRRWYSSCPSQNAFESVFCGVFLKNAPRRLERLRA